MKKHILILNGFVSVLLFSGCSRIDSLLDTKSSVDYQQNQSTVKAMEVPPDLTAPEYDSAFAMPANGTISVSEMQNGRLAPAVYNPVASSSGTGNASTSFGSSSASSAPSQLKRTGNLSSIKSQNGETVLQIHDSYPRALVLTDIILERLNFDVQRRDQSSGTYHVQYNGDNVVSSDKKGLLSKLFRRSASKTLVKGKNYQVLIKNQAGMPIIQFRTNDGQRLSANNQTQVVTILNNEFNR